MVGVVRFLGDQTLGGSIAIRVSGGAEGRFTQSCDFVELLQIQLFRSPDFETVDRIELLIMI